MAEIISGNDSISALLAEQKTTSQHLEYFKDTNEYTQDLLLEQMQTNEELAMFNVNLKQFSTVLMKGISTLADKFTLIQDNKQALEVIDVTPDNTAKKLIEMSKVLANNPLSVVQAEGVSASTGVDSGDILKKEAGAIFDVSSGKFVEPILKGNEDLLTIEKGMAESLVSINDIQLKLLGYAEAADDVGSVDVPTADKPKDDKDDKMPDIGGGMSGVLGALGKKFPKAGKLLGATGKILGKGLKILGPVGLALGGFIEFGSGVQNAAEIVGKSKDELSTLEKAGAGLAGVVEGITFGLIDAKTAYSGIEAIGSTIGGIGKDIFSMMPDSVQKGLGTVADAMFDTETGIFGFAGKTMSGVMNSLEQGNFVEAGSQLLIGGLGSIFGPEGFMARSASNTFEAVKGMAGILFDQLPASFQEPIMGVVDYVSGVWDGLVNTMTGVIDSIVESIKGVIGEKASGLLGKAAGFFGFGGDDDKKASEVVASKPAKVSNADTTVVSNLINPVEQNKSMELAPRDRMSSSVAPQRNRGVAAEVDTKDTVALSKMRMEESKQAPQSNPQPIVIQQPQSSPKKSISRETSINDTELALMSGTFMDGN
jgi:hypothetical protein